MKNKITAVVLLLLYTFTACAIILQLRGIQLNEATAAEIVGEAREKFNIPAVTISVMDSSRILYSVTDGIREDGASVPVTIHDYFHIGSCSKSVLAYVAAQLVEEGAISWDTGFFDIYPELWGETSAAYLTITLEALLSCRAGILPYTSGSEFFPDLIGSENRALDFIKYLLHQPPAAPQDGQGKFEFLYSNASYTLAVAMLEEATGSAYEALLQKYIREGLGLEVFIGWPYEISSNQPLGHLQSWDNTLTVIGPASVYALNPLIKAAGNLSMTSEDFASYVQLHLRGLTENGTGLSSDVFKYLDIKYSGFSLGAWNGTRVFKPYVCLDGTAGTYYARGVILPKSDLGFTIMMNCGSEEAAEYITMALLKAYYNWWWMFWN